MARLAALLLGLAFSLGAASAHSSGAEVQDQDGQTRAFLEQAIQIRADLAAGDRYSGIRSTEQDTVLRLLHRMEALLARAGSVESLSKANKVRLFNDQERINNILTSASSNERTVCERTRITGTHRRQSVCLSVAEREHYRESGKQQMLSHQRNTTY